jgi:glycosyltransferase involved in cell wall biosynthesis
MRVAILNTQQPFIRGGAELLADALRDELESRGHEAAVVRLPFRWHPSQAVLECLLEARLTRIAGADRVIALKFPAYCVPHENKVLWLLHQFRQAYDLWGNELGDLKDTPEDRRIRQAVIEADNRYLVEAKAIYTNNAVVSERLRQHNGLGSTVLYPPLIHPETYRSEEPGDYWFYPSRMSGSKRQALAIEAMSHVESPVRLVVAGPPDSADEQRRLEQLIERLGLHDRVQLIPRWITHEEKVSLYAGALGCIYIPFDEDSYGYVTLEAYEAERPVVTCTDSGGTRDVVLDGRTGAMAEPTPEALAAAIDRLSRDRDAAREQGRAGRAHIEELGITWDRVLERLLG